MGNLRSCTYILEGNPIPLARARMSRYGIWDSQKEIKLISSLKLKQQHNSQPYFIGPLHLELKFFLPKPLKGPNRRKYYHPYKPDLDNLIKFCADIANQILYEDDAIIASIYAIKVYDFNPRIEFTLTELSDCNNEKEEQL